VANIAKRYIKYTYTGSGLSYLDLIQAGNEALIESVDSFNHERGCKVITYAGRNIQWRIKDTLTDQARLVRYPQHHYENLPKFERIKQNPSGSHELSPAEVAGEMGISENYAQDLETLAKYTLTPVDYTLSSPSPSHEELIDSQRADEQIQETVQQGLAALPEKERVVVRMRYGFDGKSEEIVPFRQLGQKLGISQEGARKREKGAFEKLVVTLKDLPTVLERTA
jgi:RNA polymerase sigma factor (sigma-70 family)